MFVRIGFLMIFMWLATPIIVQTAGEICSDCFLSKDVGIFISL